jgi:hypothetical protein
MPETIFVIGNTSREYINALSSNGYAVKRFLSPERAMNKLKDASLLIMDRDQDSKELVRASRKIPKIIISKGHSKRKIGPWLSIPRARAFRQGTNLLRRKNIEGVVSWRKGLRINAEGQGDEKRACVF